MGRNGGKSVAPSYMCARARVALVGRLLAAGLVKAVQVYVWYICSATSM